MGKALKKAEKKVKAEMVSSNSSTKKEEETSTNSTDAKLEVFKNLKLHEFKITGQVGDKEGCIDYMSLSHQMKEGKIRYSSKEIMSGVIKAMKAGSSLRKYFESTRGLTEENFIKILRSHYNVEDPTTLFNKMANASQDEKESEVNFVLRMMDMRNNIITLSEEEGCPFDATLVRKKFFHSLAVGFKTNSIRLALGPTLKDVGMGDDKLMDEVSRAMAGDREHQSKLKNKVLVNKLDARDADQRRDEQRQKSSKKSEDSEMMAEIRKLSQRMGEVSQLNAKVNELTTEYQKLRKQMTEAPPPSQSTQNETTQRYEGNQGGSSWNNQGYQNRQYGGRQYSRPFVKCKNCNEKNLFCTHCSQCGKGDHKRRDCPLNC